MRKVFSALFMSTLLVLSASAITNPEEVEKKEAESTSSAPTCQQLAANAAVAEYDRVYGETHDAVTAGMAAARVYGHILDVCSEISIAPN